MASCLVNCSVEFTFKLAIHETFFQRKEFIQFLKLMSTVCYDSGNMDNPGYEYSVAGMTLHNP